MSDGDNKKTLTLSSKGTLGLDSKVAEKVKKTLTAGGGRSGGNSIAVEVKRKRSLTPGGINQPSQQQKPDERTKALEEALKAEKKRQQEEAKRRALEEATKTEEEREAARVSLNKMRRDTSPTRLKNRCRLTGRPHAYLRKFGMSRICFRELAGMGMIPGVTKASW